MKNVIVTGGSGFVGQGLVRALRTRFDCSVQALGSSDVDLVNQKATFDWFEQARERSPNCDHIIHLAALYLAGGWPVDHPATQFHANMCINVNILEAWRRFLPKAKLTSVLSYCMYPPHDDPHPESELWGTEPEDYLFAYAATKKALLIGQRAYRQEYGLRSTSVVLPTVYGPGDSFAENAHVMGALVGKFVRASVNRAATVEVWGDGRQEREFLFIEDAADGIIQAAQRSETDVLNLGTGTCHTIAKVAATIRGASGFSGLISQNTNRFVGVQKRLLDVSRVRQVLGWNAATSIEEGIERTVQWYRESLLTDGTMRTAHDYLTEKGQHFELVAVDDSDDGTWEILEEFQSTHADVVLIKGGDPPGYGKALRQGFNAASGEILIPFNGDLCDSLDDVMSYIGLIEGGYDMAFGSRYMKGGQILDHPSAKVWLSRLGNQFIQVLHGLECSDVTNTFKAYRREVLDEVRSTANGYDLGLEIAIKASRRGYRYKTIPVVWSARQHGVSKMVLAKSLVTHLRTALGIWLMGR
ncbi:MAG: Epimerase protein [Chloroflexi bacterium]|nr:Epimerase protein [Chloroflexota bacterium]